MKTVITILLAMIAAVAVANPIDNDTCDSAAFLIDQGFTSFDVDLCQFDNDYLGCDDQPAAGPDAVWRALVRAGDDIRLFATPMTGEFQVKMYLVTDCGDVAGSCVVTSDGDQTQQVIDFRPEVADLFFLIVDSVEGCGVVHVEMGGVLATETHSWSSVKSLY
ncbi:MAG: hypothetical protein R3D98_09740 [Candidatus Krumholzibacteriia bacterium]